MKTVRICAAVVVGLLGHWAPFRAVASPLPFTFGNIEAADVVQLNYAPLGGLSGDLFYAGQYTATVDAGTPSAHTINTFCVDLLDEVNIGQPYTVNLLPTNPANPTPSNPGLVNAAAINFLYQTYGQAPITSSSPVVKSLTSNPYGLDAADYGTALQLAIWMELADDGKAGVLGSGLPLTYSLDTAYGGNATEVSEQLTTFLNAANVAARTNPTLNGLWLQTTNTTGPQPRGQGFLNPVPEPSTWILAGTGFGCLLVQRRWPRRNSGQSGHAAG